MPGTRPAAQWSGVDRCVVVGWSVGVTVAAQLALQHPERVSGLLLVAGVPGAMFGSMGGMSGLPDGVRAPLARTVTRKLHAAGPVFDAVRHDWRWYSGLALAVGSRPPLDLAALRCPVTVLAGRYDLLADVEHVTRRMAGVPQARMRLVPASHFLPLEAPDVLHRAEAVDRALRRSATGPADGPGPVAPLTHYSRAGA